MSATYDYTKASVNLDKLTLEIYADQTIEKTPEGLTNDGGALDNLHITFDDVLTLGEEAALDALVASHDGQPPTSYHRFCQTCAYNWMERALIAPTECPCCEGQNIIDPDSSTPALVAAARSLILVALGGTTGYAGGQTGFLCWHGFYAVESPAQHRMPKSSVRRLTVNVSTNTLNTASTLTVKKNGVLTDLVLTVPPLGTGIHTATGEIEFADGDLFGIQCALGGNGGQGFYPKGGHIEIITEE